MVSGHESEAVRKEGVSMWLRINAKYPEYWRHTIRQFRLPKINFTARNLRDLIITRETEMEFAYQIRNGEWQLLTLPPVLKGLSFSDVRKYVKKTFSSEYPNHTQVVEMNVKLTSFVTRQVIGNTRQTGQGLAIRSSLEEMPSKKPKKLLKN